MMRMGDDSYFAQRPSENSTLKKLKEEKLDGSSLKD
jgi:hypothetical protein